MGVARQIGGLFRLDVKVAGKRDIEREDRSSRHG